MIQNTSPHHVRKQLLKNSTLDVESVGKADIETLSDVADSPGGKGTIIRLIMGASVSMPLRAISYVDTALRVASVLPCEQIHIVHANRLGAQINRVDKKRSAQSARLLAALSQFHAQAFFPGLVSKLIHGQDMPVDLDDCTAAAEQVFARDQATASALLRKGTKHGGDALAYAAAHAAFQDTNLLRIEPLLEGMPEQCTAQRIVSVGCQQERLFYNARMAMRPILAETVELVRTAQVFTRHVSPPYFVARGGEQLLDDAISNGFDLEQFTDAAARRDIERFRSAIGVNHG